MVQYIGRRTDGISMGKSITDTISFYGVTPVAQPAATAQGVITELRAARCGWTRN